MTWRGPLFDKGDLRPTVASGRAESWTRTLNLGYVLSSQKVTRPLALTFTSWAPIFTPGSPPLGAHLALPTWEPTWPYAPGSPSGSSEPPPPRAHNPHFGLSRPDSSIGLTFPKPTNLPTRHTLPLPTAHLSAVPEPIPPPRITYTWMQHVLKWWGWARLMLRRSL